MSFNNIIRFAVYFVTLLVLFPQVIYPASAQIVGSTEHYISVGNMKLHFVSRPELGYVVLGQKEDQVTKALNSILKQHNAKDIKRVGGLRRQGVFVVYNQQSAIQNRNTVAALRSHSQIKYSSPLFSSNGEPVAVIPEVVVRLKAESNEDELQELCHSLNLQIKEKLQFTSLEYLIEVFAIDADEVFRAVEQVSQASFIEWAVPNICFRPKLFNNVIPNDPYFNNQWHLNNTGQSGGTPGADINISQAWQITTGDPNIIVAVLDDGVDISHPDLADNIVAGYDFYEDDNSPIPTGNDAHGTACAGLIAARGNNGIGVTGIAWNCRIMPVRIVQGDNFISEADIANAIRWAATNGADVMNNSWGSDSTLPIIHSALIDVTEQGGIGRGGKGCVVLCASGNWEGGGSVIYPAKYEEVIAVGATNDQDIIWSYSGKGPELDIVAPSGDADLNGNLWTTDIVGNAGFNNRNPSIKDYTDKMGGTSAACSIAAGVAALVLSMDPDLMNVEVQEALQIVAADLGIMDFDYTYGHGRIDSKHSVTQVTTKQQWVARYNGAENGTDTVTGLGVDDYGNIHVTGYSDGSGEYNKDYATIKYDTNGNELWVRRYNGPLNANDTASDLAVDSLGNVYVTGSSWGDGTSIDYTTIKYDANGNELWISRYNGPEDDTDYASAIAVDNAGNVYVTGSSKDFRTNYATVKYDSEGNELWVASYNSPYNDNDDAIALAIDHSSNVYVTGNSYAGFDAKDDYVTVKYDSDGTQLWMARYNYNESSDNRDLPAALALDDSGNVYVTGCTYHQSSNSDYATIKYDTNGNKLWEQLYDGPYHKSDYPYALAVDKSGNVYVTGGSNSSDDYGAYATIKYDTNGNQLWVRHYNSPGDYRDYAVSLAVDDSGNVYVTGRKHSVYNDYTTIKYDSDGNRIWIKRYSSTGDDADSAKIVVLDDSGNVYVTGNSVGIYSDYATIKYTQQNYCVQAIDGDLNGDCIINFLDFVILADRWPEGNDWSDLEKLCDAWLECNLSYKGDCW